MDKRFGIILLTVVAVIGGIFIFTKKDTGTADTSTGVVSNHSAGAGTANVEVVEYGDFQCPACSGFFTIVEQVRETYGDKIKFTFRNFPLVSIHRNAMASHRAAEAASAQGKFFEMYELLYQNQDSWSSLSNPVSLFESYASSLGLDMTKFKTDFASEATNNVINADTNEGKDKYKVDSTPTFIINGQKMNSADVGTVELFSKKIDEAIAAAKTL